MCRMSEAGRCNRISSCAWLKFDEVLALVTRLDGFARRDLLELFLCG